jgi:hypothetical protein
VKSPMYATGVGLVINGLQEAEHMVKKNKHQLDEVKGKETQTPVGDDERPKSRNWLDFIKKSLVDDGGDQNLNG